MDNPGTDGPDKTFLEISWHEVVRKGHRSTNKARKRSESSQNFLI